MSRAVVAIVLLVLACAWLACGPPPRGVVTARNRRRHIDYTFSLDSTLSTLTARVCFDEAPGALRAIHRNGQARLLGADYEGERLELTPEGDLDLSGVPDEGCIRYRIDLSPRVGFGGSYRVGSSLVAPTTLWVWAPARQRGDDRYRARFELPEGVDVSALWPEGDAGWLDLDDRAFRFVAYAGFGRFARERVEVPGGCLDVSLLQDDMAAGADLRREWLGRAGHAAARLLGRFPAPITSILVIPVYSTDPVMFGIVGRGMMPTIALMTSRDATDSLISDWTAVHEMTHLVSPYVEREEAWLLEGLATYYQQILRAREGLLTPEDAWREMLAGFERGRREGTGRILAEESRSMRETFAFGRVYWAGAAIAFLADIEYRRRTEESLDDAMRRAGAYRDERMSAAEVIERMDGGPSGIFGTIAREWLERSDFPEVAETLEWLGVRWERGSVKLVDAPGATVRDRLMNAGPSLASNPGPCANPVTLDAPSRIACHERRECAAHRGVEQ